MNNILDLTGKIREKKKIDALRKSGFWLEMKPLTDEDKSERRLYPKIEFEVNPIQVKEITAKEFEEITEKLVNNLVNSSGDKNFKAVLTPLAMMWQNYHGEMLKGLKDKNMIDQFRAAWYTGVKIALMMLNTAEQQGRSVDSERQLINIEFENFMRSLDNDR